MIEFDRHIEILLLGNDCVVVPDLGGFVAHHVDAHYDSNDSLFLPPLRTLGFNPKLRINDSLLAQSYVETYDMSYPDAVARIEEEVNELKRHIENEGAYELHDIGTLSLNNDGNYEFEPFEAGILTPSLYGLNSIEISKLAQEAEQAEPEAQPLAAETKSMTGEQEDSHDEEASPRTVSIRVSTLKNIATIAALLLAFFFISTPLDHGNRCSFSLSEFNHDVLNKMMPKEVVKNTPSSDAKLTKNDSAPVQEIKNTPQKIQAGMQPGTLAESKESENSVETAQEKDYYVLVLASCLPMKNANSYAEQLKGKGFEDTQVISRKNGAKVVYGHYASESDAYRGLNGLQANEPFREAWVYLIKNR
ncbi:MAG: SPOR domain-containing protein [Prevotella sp.]|nr:SPOR domain-containing protein [Prevotella sp.]